MRRMSFAVIAPVALLGLTACDNPVEPDPGTPVDISYAPCLGSPWTPSWFAYQDGDGSWTRVTPTATGAFNFTLRRGRGGFATFTEGLGLFIRYASTDEIKANVPACNGSVRKVSGTVTGYASLDNMTFQLGGSRRGVSGFSTQPAAFELTDVDATATDLFARRYRTAAATTTFEEFPDRILLRRGVSGTATPLIDFASAATVLIPAKKTVNVTNIAVNEQLTLYAYIGMSTTLGEISRFQNAISFVSGSVSGPFYGLPSSALTAGETQMLFASTQRTESSAAASGRFAAVVYTDVADKSITLGPTLGTVTVTGSSRPTATYTPQTGYDGHFDVIFSQGNGASFRQIEVLTTKAYLATATTVKLEVPNLSGVNGFQSTWLLATGVSSTWSFRASSADISILNNKPMAYMGAERTSAFTP